MRAAFSLKSTRAAKVAMGRRQVEILDDAVAIVEKLDPGEDDYAILEVKDLDLKVVVQFGHRIIHVMTCAEAKQSGLPDKPV
jgi:hypothetical protein